MRDFQNLCDEKINSLGGVGSLLNSFFLSWPYYDRHMLKKVMGRRDYQSRMAVSKTDKNFL